MTRKPNLETSRRSLVVGAAAMPALAVPAVAAIEPDEIYAAIEAHSRAYDRYIAALHAADVKDLEEIEGDPERAAEIVRIDQLKKVADDASTEERRLLWDLVSTVPDTFMGVTAVLAYLRTKENGSLGTLMDVEYIEQLLLSVEYTICAHAGLPEPQIPEHDLGNEDDEDA
jgi:hypothetical protein